MANAALAAQAAGQPAAQPAAQAPPPEAPKGPTVEELQQQLAKYPTLEEFEQIRELARVGYQYTQELRQRQTQPPPAKPGEPNPYAPHPVTGVVPFSEADKAWLTTDNGEVKAIPGAPADILTRFHQHQRTQAEFFRNFAMDPTKYGFVTKEQAEKIAEERYQQLSRGQTQAQTVEQILAENAPWIYEQGPNGQAKVDWAGNPKRTEAGELWVSFTERLAQSGMTDPAMVNKVAKEMVIAHYYARRQQQQAAAPAAAQPAAQTTIQQKDDAAKLALLQRAGQAAASAPLVGMPAVPVVPNGRPKKFEEIAAEKMAQAGLSM